ncbi:helix-turn-helix transcriptional regulator [Streptomyces niger]|uniref:helix-turn-helix transcriptional regulator n=1 Tax=Streptomyces niger TaxID=66373 RepID=UPI000699ABF5|nr:LuxR family transcriptional regulator [Streptomyces niger]
MTADNAGLSDSAAQTPLLDRRAELRTIGNMLRAFAADPSARHGPLLLEGMSGMGKTTLLDVVRRQAAGLGLSTLGAVGFPHSDRAYLMARQWFLDVARELALTPLERRLLGLEPPGRLVDRSVNSVFAPLERAVVLDAWDGIAAGVVGLRGPLVLLLDDAHWADPYSLDWLHRLIRQQPGRPLLVALARRTEEPSRTHRPLTELAGLPGAVRMALRPLTYAAVCSMAEDLLRAPPDPAFGSALYRATGGVPFTVVDTCRRAAADGIRPVAGNAQLIEGYALPGIGEGLIRLLGRLGAVHMRTARALAVLGPNATPVLTGRLAGLTPDRAAASLDRLRNALLLANERTAFVHPPFADAVYDAIPQGERGRLHARAARLLVEAGHGPEVAAVHLLAAPSEGSEWAVEHLRAAAAQSLAAGAPEDADLLLARAQEEPPMPGLRGDLHYERGVATFPVDPQRSAAHLRAALADGRPRDAAVRLLAKALAHENRLPQAVGMLHQESRRSTTSGSRRRLLAERFLWSAFWEDAPDAADQHRLLGKLTDRLTGDTVEHRRLLILRAWYATLRGDPVAGVLAAVRPGTCMGLVWTGDRGDFDCGLLAALVYFYCGRTGRAEQILDDGIAELRARRWCGGHLALALALRALVLLHTGRLAAAQAESECALRIAAGLRPMAYARWYALSTALSVLLARGKAAQAAELCARERFDAPFPAAVVLPTPRCVLAELRAEQGRTAEAVKLLMEAGQRQWARLAENPAVYPWQSLLAQVLSGRDRAAARDRADEAVRRARVFGEPAATGEALSRAGVAYGGMAGLRLLAEAVELLRGTDDTYRRAQALTEYGDALRRAGRSAEARKVLREGRATACRAGAEKLAERARAARRLAGGRDRTRIVPGLEGLTERQCEVGALAAAGLTNQDIANRLVISTHTVAKHLTTIYGLLGVTREALGDLPWPGLGPV